MDPETFGSILSTFKSDGVVNVGRLRVIDGDAGLGGEIESCLISGMQRITLFEQLPGLEKQVFTESVAPGRSRD
ncbi:MAG: Uncharacterised protein [Cyanobium sp. ARS6]|nr:MAG: Uncharacterised protein [Cyanobium sp. ARS6]